MMNTPLTLQEILERARKVFGEQEIVSRIEDGSLHRTTYSQLHTRVLKLMGLLERLGIEPGDRVGTFAWNSYRHLELYFAIPCLGAVLHTVNVRLPEDQLRHILTHAETRVLFVDRCFAETLAPYFARGERLGKIEQVIVLDDHGNGASQGIEGALDYETLLSEASPIRAMPTIRDEQAAGLCYTSGTTGSPKGVLYSHRAYWIHSLGSTGVDSMAVSRTDAMMPVVPMFHANAWGFPYTCAMAGAKQVFPGQHLLGRPLAELIESERVTLAAGVPTVWNVLLQHLRKNDHDVSSLRNMIVGGSAAPVSLIRAYKEELGITITHAWGMTETTPVGCCSRLKSTSLALDEDDQIELRGKQGIPVPGIDVKIEGDDGSDLAWDGEQVGELCVRGPWVARSYYEDEERQSVFAADGWFHTGDVATIDVNGYIHITDRKKDLIKSRGEWISSVDMENVAMAHPGVLEAAVTGRPDALRDEVPVLWVVASPEVPAPAPADLVAHLGQRFAQWQLPRLEDIRFIEAIPKTSVGKFDKKALRRRMSEGD